MPRLRPTVVPRAAAAVLSTAAAVDPDPVFELHIRPLFRSLDRENMSWWANLWQYPEGPGANPVARYTQILNRLRDPNADSVMPPIYAGGPWPREWIALFERWLALGAPRLALAVLDPAQLSAVRVPGTSSVGLAATVTLPSAGHVAWLERRFAGDRMFSPELPDEFIVYQRMMTVGSPAPTPWRIDAELEIAPSITSVRFSGANGTFPAAII